MRPQGVDLEFIDRHGDANTLGTVVPSEIRINSAPVLVPEGSPIIIGEMNSNSLVQVTLTVLARSISIRAEIEGSHVETMG